MVEEGDRIIYKMEVPLLPYLYRIMLAAVPIILAVMGIDYRMIIATMLMIGLLWITSDYYVIKIYSDHFKIISPSFVFNFFNKEEIFYYKNIEGYRFTNGNFDLSNFLFLELIRRFISIAFVEGMGSYRRYSIMEFIYNYEGNTNSIKRKFPLLQSKQLIKANEIIEGVLRKEGHASDYHVKVPHKK